MDSQKKNITFILSTILLIMCLVIFFVMAILVINKYSFYMDRLNYFVADNRSDLATGFFKIFTYFGQFYFLMIVVLLVLIIVKEKRVGISLLTGLGLASLFNLVVKSIIKRMRPVDLMIIEEIGHSFPSAHAMLSMVVFGFLIYFIARNVKNRPAKIISIILLTLLILFTGFSRVYLGVHYASDIVAGWLAGIVFVILTISILNMLNAIKFSKITRN